MTSTEQQIEHFICTLVSLGGSAGNQRLLEALGWQDSNRIVSENSDFHRFVERVGIYHQTGRLVKSVWNK